MSEEFDQDAAFEQIWSLWPERYNQKPKARAQERTTAIAVFYPSVQDEITFKRVLEAVEGIIEDTNGRPKDQLVSVIAVGIRPPKVETEEKPVQKKAPAVPPQILPPAEADAFDDIWEDWPQNEEHPETEDKARAGWEEAAMRHSAETLSIACNHYIESFANPSKGMKYPKHLSNFVRDDDAIETAIMAAAHVIPPGDIYEFEAVWRLYPKFPEKDDPEVKKASLTFWRRHIRISERPDFLCSVGAYKTKRKDRMATVMPGEFEDAQIYTKSLVSFIGGWKTQPGLARAMGDMLARPLLVLYKANGGGYSWNEWIKNAIMYCGSKWPEERLVGAAKRVLEEMSSGGSGDNITIDILTLAAKAVNDAYVLACKPRESMASSPGATSP